MPFLTTLFVDLIAAVAGIYFTAICALIFAAVFYSVRKYFATAPVIRRVKRHRERVFVRVNLVEVRHR